MPSLMTQVEEWWNSESRDEGEASEIEKKCDSCLQNVSKPYWYCIDCEGETRSYILQYSRADIFQQQKTRSYVTSATFLWRKADSGCPTIGGGPSYI